MSPQNEPFRPQRRIGKVLVAIVACLWVWKILETVGRQTGVLRRNLGRGYVVNLTIPAAATVALAVFFIARWVARRVAARRGSCPVAQIGETRRRHAERSEG